VSIEKPLSAPLHVTPTPNGFVVRERYDGWLVTVVRRVIAAAGGITGISMLRVVTMVAG